MVVLDSSESLVGKRSPKRNGSWANTNPKWARIVKESLLDLLAIFLGDDKKGEMVDKYL